MIKVNISEALQELVTPVIRKMALDAIENEIALCRRKMDERLSQVAMEAAKQLQLIVQKLPDKLGDQIDIVLTIKEGGEHD